MPHTTGYRSLLVQHPREINGQLDHVVADFTGVVLRLRVKSTILIGIVLLYRSPLIQKFRECEAHVAAILSALLDSRDIFRSLPRTFVHTLLVALSCEYIGCIVRTLPLSPGWQLVNSFPGILPHTLLVLTSSRPRFHGTHILLTASLLRFSRYGLQFPHLRFCASSLISCLSYKFSQQLAILIDNDFMQFHVHQRFLWVVLHVVVCRILRGSQQIRQISQNTVASSLSLEAATSALDMLPGMSAISEAMPT
ncbi:unnamed protein product [Trypanosoma congolense IL3000]|uniref:WGS project CAEQ00000000 data, annotated contig 481 n=1 Tax=Trypanosoma congolense (strain IL3000) TaxID=1068625 RepID=F9WGA8_TRYCI|nr:unnamed protein product [Trypanosoma congolense IL3000]